MLETAEFAKTTGLKELENEIANTDALFKKKTHNTDKSTLKPKTMKVEREIPKTDDVMKSNITSKVTKIRKLCQI